MSKIRVMIVDDAVVVRQILSTLLAEDPHIEVVGTASNGKIALSKLPLLKPDVVTLDMEMPEMDGIATLRELRRVSRTLPVIMFSTLTERGAAATMDALAAGATDYVTKPANVGSVQTAIARIKSELIPKIKSFVGHDAPAKTAALPTPRAVKNTAGYSPISAIAIGVSTGGPNALADLLPALPKDLPVPIFIVQHMPPMFTKFLAERLAAKSALKVCEATAGMRITPGVAYLAPGDFHMTVERLGSSAIIGLNQQAAENSCRPAVDVLFRSAAKHYGAHCLGVILTGMGSDGLHGCEALAAVNARIIAQDQASSVVWGMPGIVAEHGLANQILPLNRVAAEIIRLVETSTVRLAS